MVVVFQNLYLILKIIDLHILTLSRVQFVFKLCYQRKLTGTQSEHEIQLSEKVPLEGSGLVAKSNLNLNLYKPLHVQAPGHAGTH